MSQEQAKAAIQKLIAKYEAVKASGKLGKYTEEETKRGFIEPLFAALGWDFLERSEVTLEEQISGDRVDYGFYRNGRIKFYLEAKPLKADLHKEIYAHQAIKYSWNKGVTWAVLSDFESLIVFNAMSAEKTLGGKRFFEIPYSEYISRFDQLWLLSKAAFEADLLDAEARKVGKKLQKVSVTDQLSKDLNECRQQLTHSFRISNEKVDEHLIDEGVQKLLNRLIFIRVAEDRKVEPPTLIPLIHQWEAGGRKGTPFAAMVEKFRELDKVYNSSVFEEHAFEKWDELDGATQKVIDILYGKKGYVEYDFSAIPADVLGAVYENYLGYKLQQSEKKKNLFGADLELSKDSRKRKEQGIYYTPTFIVDYIVKNALGPVLDRCTSVGDLQKIKVLDPACGSGSFLIRAMDEIAKKYEEFGAKIDANIKIQILTRNIYGVDLDEQAVEIARLNLLLNTFDAQTKLPTLDSNIKNGNSLISGTDEELEKYFGKNFRDKKPFNWHDEFPEVFSQGGFDCIIGNPPYVFARGQNFDKAEKKYYYSQFKQQYQINTFSLFIEQGIKLLKNDGHFGYIIPNNWLTINSFSYLREYLLKNFADLKIINAVESVFKASVDTCLLLFSKSKPTNVELGELKDGLISYLHKHQPKEFFDNDYILKIAPEDEHESSGSFKYIFEKCISLGGIARVSTGLKAYQVGKGRPVQTEDGKKDRKFHSDKPIDKTYSRYLDGRDVKRYEVKWSGEYLSYGDWLAEPRKSVPFEGKRILVRQIPSPYPHCVNGVLISEKYLNDINSMIIFEPSSEYDLRYILGVINSKLLSYWFVKTFDKFQRKIFPQFKVNELAHFPIYPTNRAQQKSIILLVEKMLLLSEKIKNNVENSDDWKKLKSEIKKIDKKIDEEVYRLYSLSEDEIKIIESNADRA